MVRKVSSFHENTTVKSAENRSGQFELQQALVALVVALLLMWAPFCDALAGALQVDFLIIKTMVKIYLQKTFTWRCRGRPPCVTVLIIKPRPWPRLVGNDNDGSDSDASALLRQTDQPSLARNGQQAGERLEGEGEGSKCGSRAGRG